MNEADQIKEAIRIKGLLSACKTHSEVHDVAKAERDNVRALNSGELGKLLVIDIVNLKKYMLDRLSK